MRDALGHERNPQRIETVNLCGVALEHESHAALECSVLGAEDKDTTSKHRSDDDDNETGNGCLQA